MADEYKAPRLFNRIVMWVNRTGMGRAQTLTTTGRRSGSPRSVPVSPMRLDGTEYLVAPYGEVSWVLNARANPDITMSKGSQVRRCQLVEITDSAAAVVKAYWDKESYPRRYMDVPGDASVADFEVVAGRFPVFRVEQKQ